MPNPLTRHICKGLTVMKRAAIYARVSTSEQTKGTSLKSQVQDCKQYAKRHNLTVVKTIEEDISGAIRLEERPSGKQLWQLVETNQIDAVIVWRLDRLSRPPEGEYSQLLTTIEKLNRHDVTVHDCETGQVKNDMTSIMIAFFKGLAASQERENIRIRTMRGIHEKAKSGKWIGQGDPPYGYIKVGTGRDAYLEIHEERAAIVRRIFDLYIGKYGKPMTLKQIAVLLTHEGILSPGQVKHGGRTGRGGWYVATISKRILANENYIGRFTAQGMVLEMPELAIVDQETWDLAQARKERNKVRAKRNKKRKYLLSSHLRCACGGALVGESKKRRKGGYNVYYRCPKHRYDHIEKCSVGYIRIDAIERPVWDWLSGFLNDPQKVRDGLEYMAETARVQMKPLQTRLSVIDDLLSEAEGEINRIVSAFGKMDDEVVARALKSNVDEKVELKNSLLQEKASLKLKLAQAEITPELKDQIIQMATEIAVKLPKGSFEKKRLLLDILNVRVALLHDNDGGYLLEATCSFSPNPMLIEYFDSGFESRCPV